MDRCRRSHDCQLNLDLEGELAGVFCRIDRAFGLGVAGRRLEQREPFPNLALAAQGRRES
jgi:hypothetical protein